MSLPGFLAGAVPFLDGISAEQAVEISKRVETRSYAKGQTIVFRGTTVDGLHIVKSGKVAVWIKPTRGGNTPVLAAELGAGEVFGETSIIESGTAAATVRASEDETIVLLLPQDAFVEVLASNTDLRARAEALMSTRKASNAAQNQPSAN